MGFSIDPRLRGDGGDVNAESVGMLFGEADAIVADAHDCKSLMPLWFPHGCRRYPCSNPLGARPESQTQVSMAEQAELGEISAVAAL